MTYPIDENITVQLATLADLTNIVLHDTHISKAALSDKIARNEIYVAYNGNIFIGWLRYGMFWDIIPFMNMLEILPPYQGKGYGRQLVEFWHVEMKAQGHKQVMTSTQQNENAQHFYNKLGYVGVGGFVQSFEPLNSDSYEIILLKRL